MPTLEEQIQAALSGKTINPLSPEHWRIATRYERRLRPVRRASRLAQQGRIEIAKIAVRLVRPTAPSSATFAGRGKGDGYVRPHVVDGRTGLEVVVVRTMPSTPQQATGLVKSSKPQGGA